MEALALTRLVFEEYYRIALVFLYGVLLSVILTQSKNPTKTISRLLIVMLFPVIGIILYYFFGRKHLRFKTFQYSDKTFSGLSSTRSQHILDLLEQDIGSLTSVFQYLQGTKSSFVTQHNETKLLINGEEKFQHLIEDITQAQHSIMMEYYTFDYDTIGKKIFHLLEEKARQGVKVHVLVDSLGSAQLLRTISAHNTPIVIQEFLPIKFHSLANTNYRNHRKICIIDNTISYIGGINIADKYINDTQSKTYRRDIALRISGEASGLLGRYFSTHRQQTTQHPIAQTSCPEPIITTSSSSTSHLPIIFALNTPNDLAAGFEALILGIAHAKTSIQLTTPYYIPNETLERALINAATRGVKVELLIPHKGDSVITQRASISFIGTLLKHDIKVFRYQHGFIHSKTIVIDTTLSYVGTMNLDNRSFFLNFELMAILSDSSLTQALKKEFAHNLTTSKEFTREEWQQRGIYRKSIDLICRLLSPLL